MIKKITWLLAVACLALAVSQPSFAQSAPPVTALSVLQQLLAAISPSELPVDCSGTIATGGVAQTIIPTATGISGFQLQNVDASAGSGEPIWFSLTSTAAPGIPTSYELIAPTATTQGGAYTALPNIGVSNQISVIAATTGHKFSCTYWAPRINQLMVGVPGANFGINNTLFFDDFTTINTIDSTNSQAMGFNWYLNNINSYQGGATGWVPESSSNYSVANSILTIYADPNFTSGQTIATRNFNKTASQLQGSAPLLPGNRPFYAEARLKLTAQQYSAWWMEDAPAFLRSILNSGPSTLGAEFDMVEIGGPNQTVHVWSGPATLTTPANTSVTWDATIFHTFGVMVVPRAYNNGIGFSQFYIDRLPSGLPLSWSGADTYGIEGSNFMMLWASANPIVTPPQNDYVLVANASVVPQCLSPVGATQFDPCNTAFYLQLTNYNLTVAQAPSPSSFFGNLLTNVSHSSGKYYAEIHFDQGALGYSGFGICNAAELHTAYIGYDANGVAYSTAAGVLLNGSNIGPSYASVVGQTMAIAVDLTNKLIWFNNGLAGGAWNGDVSNNPATGVGGISIAGLNAGPYYICAEAAGYPTLGSQMTANFGVTSYVGTPPSGFGNW